jgi:hypothetical protein
MAYALPNSSGNFSIGDYFEYVVTIDPNFFTILLFGIWFILFIGLRASPNLTTPVSITTASFGTLLLSVILMTGGFIGSASTLYFIGMMVIGIILLMIEAG